MKVLIALLVMFNIQTALAEDVPAEVVTNEVRATMGVRVGNAGRIYYECDALEHNVTEFLTALGATNIDIRCTGGYDPFGITTLARIRGSFDSVVAVEGSENFGRFADINLRDRDNCALVAELFHVLGDSFTIAEISGRGSRVTSSCRSSSPYNVNLTILQ